MSSSGDYPTIQAAIYAAEPSDEIIVSLGTYVENINVGGKNMIMCSTERKSPTLVGSDIIDGNEMARSKAPIASALYNSVSLGFDVADPLDICDDSIDGQEKMEAIRSKTVLASSSDPLVGTFQGSVEPSDPEMSLPDLRIIFSSQGTFTWNFLGNWGFYDEDLYYWIWFPPLGSNGTYTYTESPKELSLSATWTGRLKSTNDPLCSCTKFSFYTTNPLYPYLRISAPYQETYPDTEHTNMWGMEHGQIREMPQFI